MNAFRLCGDDAGGHEVVGSESEFAAQPAESTAEGETGDSGRGINSGRRGEAMCLGRAIHIAQRCSRLDVSPAGRRVHPNFLHGGKVNHQAAVAHGVTGDVVAAATNGDDELVFAGILDGVHHVGLGAATHDERRLAVNHAVPDRAGFVVAGVARQNDGSVEALF